MSWHFPKDDPETDSPENDIFRGMDLSQFLTEEDSAFTAKEVINTSRTRMKKKIGIDGIPIEVINEAMIANRHMFVKILNRCLKEYFPEAWKKAKLVLFNKEEKDGECISSYRPICLPNTWSKVLNKLVTMRLMFYL